MKNKLLLIVGFALTVQMITAQVPSYVPTDGLSGWWGFSGNANDATSNANNGVVSGATLVNDRFGNADSAYDFNGVNNKIVTSNATFQLNGEFTISTWINLNSLSVLNYDATVVSQNVSTANGSRKFFCGYRRQANNKGMALYIYDASNIQYDNASVDWNPQVNKWYHVVWIFKPGVSVSIYIDGQLQYQNTVGVPTTINSSGNVPLSFGYGTDDYNNPFNGKIDDIGIWNRALTLDEINNLYNANICYQSITVTDTLIINTGVLSYNPVTYNSTVTIYPNPAKDHITIDCGTLANVTGYQIKIYNELGQEVFSGAMNTQQYFVPLNTWTGQGLYFVKIFDASSNILSTKKIILE